MGKTALILLVVLGLGYYFLWPGDEKNTSDTDGAGTETALASNHAGAESATKSTSKPAKKVVDLTIPVPVPVKAAKQETVEPTRLSPPKPKPEPVIEKPATPIVLPKPVEAPVKKIVAQAESQTLPPALAVHKPARPVKLVPTPQPIKATPESTLPRFTGEPGSPLAKGLAMIDQGQVIEGRQYLSDLLVNGGDRLSARGAETIRESLSRINGGLIFSPRVIQGDPMTTEYTVQGGDLLLRVARKFGVSYQFLEQINGISARRIRPGQRIKVVRGPFHAVVSKADYRMDMFLVGEDQKMTYVRSFPVGLGTDGSTPVGNWVVRRNGKLENPSWTDPRTNKFFAPDDPMNPIGEFWIGLKGTDEQTANLSGYGIHGTVEPESIGQSASRGCIRMYADDIAMVYRMLVGSKSTVAIQP